MHFCPTSVRTTTVGANNGMFIFNKSVWYLVSYRHRNIFFDFDFYKCYALYITCISPTLERKLGNILLTSYLMYSNPAQEETDLKLSKSVAQGKLYIT